MAQQAEPQTEAAFYEDPEWPVPKWLGFTSKLRDEIDALKSENAMLLDELIKLRQSNAAKTSGIDTTNCQE